MQKVARIFAGLSQAQASILCAFVFLILFVQANLSLLLKLASLAKDEKCKAENIKLVAMDFDREDLAGALVWLLYSRADRSPKCASRTRQKFDMPKYRIQHQDSQQPQSHRL